MGEKQEEIAKDEFLKLFKKKHQYEVITIPSINNKKQFGIEKEIIISIPTDIYFVGTPEETIIDDKTDKTDKTDKADKVDKNGNNQPLTEENKTQKKGKKQEKTPQNQRIKSICEKICSFLMCVATKCIRQPRSELNQNRKKGKKNYHKPNNFKQPNQPKKQKKPKSE